jgi:hypothetical protein
MEEVGGEIKRGQGKQEAVPELFLAKTGFGNEEETVM